MKKSDLFPILLIEGNPYNTTHAISREAIKGALVSVAVSWQIPIVYSKDTYDSAEILIMAAKQSIPKNYYYFHQGSKPKRIQRKRVCFLQGLPMVGGETAKALIDKFKNLENIILATEDELQEVAGVGKIKARLIRRFLTSNQ